MVGRALAASAWLACSARGKQQRVRPLNSVVRRHHMDTRTIWLVLVVVVLAGAATFWARSARGQGNPDAWVISQLKQAGSDLAKPHPIEFFLYVPSSEAADRVAAKVRGAGFNAKVDRAAKGSAWLVLATKAMVPVEAELAAIRKDFSALASAERGEYDGWGTPVVK